MKQATPANRSPNAALGGRPPRASVHYFSGRPLITMEVKGSTSQNVNDSLTHSAFRGEWAKALNAVDGYPSSALNVMPTVAMRTLSRFLTVVVFLAACAAGNPSPMNAYAVQEGYKQYVDPAGRFSFDYPASMRCDRMTPDTVELSHPEATLRIVILLEPRKNKKPLDPKNLLESFKKNLSETVQEAVILEQGRLPAIQGTQGYFICTFNDKKGRKIMQLVQYCVSEDKMFQMIISDRPQGFLNVEKVIRHVHRSLKILKPSL